jgi:putative FmdB family regulatory protein
MPTYDFECEKCKHNWEVIHGIREPHPDTCPECGSKKVHQDFSHPPAVHNYYSPMHPRFMRGMRGHTKPKPKDKK